jgi:hypothetical protein
MEQLERGVETRLAEFRQRLGAKDQRTLLDYWLAKRGRRRMPSRADVDPAELVGLSRLRAEEAAYDEQAREIVAAFSADRD